MINALKLLFGAVLVVMLYVTVTAGLERGPLGNIAMSVYVLAARLFRLPPGAGAEHLLLRPRA
jgi:uncharacterized membrane protein